MCIRDRAIDSTLLVSCRCTQIRNYAQDLDMVMAMVSFGGHGYGGNFGLWPQLVVAMATATVRPRIVQKGGPRNPVQLACLGASPFWASPKGPGPQGWAQRARPKGPHHQDTTFCQDRSFRVYPGILAEKPILVRICLLYTSPSPRDKRQSRMPSSA